MVDANLAHHTLVFDPDLDLENVAELPGKDSMAAVVEALAHSKIACSKLIQDSHGWCFYIRGDDSRRYLVELGYVATTNRTSEWVLTCGRSAGLRLWELFQPKGTAIGLEQRYLDIVVEILASHHGFEKARAA